MSNEPNGSQVLPQAKALGDDLNEQVGNSEWLFEHVLKEVEHGESHGPNGLKRPKEPKP